MKKRVISVALVALLSAGALCGCGNNGADNAKKAAAYEPDPIVNEPGVFPICKDKDITLTVGIAQSSVVTDYENNTFTKALEEKLGCNIEFELLPSTETQQKVELMIAAGGEDLPDILMMSFEDNQLAAYGKNGTIIDLSPYYENSAYYLNKMFDAEKEKYGEDIKKLITLSDGSMYYIPKYNKSLQNEYGNRMWVYEPWLEKLGLEKPETLEEYKAMLKAFKEKDPNGNGKADEIPASGHKDDKFIEFIMASFVPVQTGNTDYLYVDDKGKVNAAYMQEEWREGLRYLNGLYKEGLLSDVKFTQDTTQLRQLNSQAEVRVGSLVTQAPSLAVEYRSRLADYTHIKPLKNGKKGISRAVWEPTTPYCGMVITKNCEHPELAFRLGDLMCEETLTIWNRWGEEGVDWTAPKEGEKSMFENIGYKARISPILIWGEPSNHHWQNIGPGYRDYDVACGMVASDSNISEMIIAEAAPDYLDTKYEHLVKKYIYDIDKYSEVSQYKGDLKNYVTEQMALFITGNRDLDKDWKDYISHLKSLGVEKYVEITQEAYDKYTK